MLFYQDFNEQFEGYTQPVGRDMFSYYCCFIRISMNNLKDIHNCKNTSSAARPVVLSGFQWTIWRIYTTSFGYVRNGRRLFYQDFNEQFEGYTQHYSGKCRLILVVLSGFQWTIWRIYTTMKFLFQSIWMLFYQDFNEQFEGYTQRHQKVIYILKVVLSGFQWTIWRIYTTV